MKKHVFTIVFAVFICIANAVRAQQLDAYFTTPVCSNQTWNTLNDSTLWHEAYWWDAATSSTDKCEEPVALCINIKDSCTVGVAFLLFLDLDGDSLQETVVRSTQLGAGGLGWNQIRYNNLNTPDYAGGELRAFDERPVAADQKYGFALEETATDSGKIACLRFNTESAPDVFVPLQLPHGKHRIQWILSDSCGNQQVYEDTFSVKDCQAPVFSCKTGIVSYITSQIVGGVTFTADQLIDTISDNCTPKNGLKLGVRICGEGYGFPVDDAGNPVKEIFIDCCHASTNCLQVWAMDASGNVDSCSAMVVVIDFSGNCECGVFVDGRFRTEESVNIPDVEVRGDQISVFSPPSYLTDISDIHGKYKMGAYIPFADISIKPERKDNPLNGVTTYDLVLLSKHILGIAPLSSPYKMIAADANKSGSVTSFDMVELRKLILGIYTKLPDNNSWRFVDKAFVFPNPQNPFQTPFPEKIELHEQPFDAKNQDFVGIKVGDLNDSAVPFEEADIEERSAFPAYFEATDRQLRAGEVFDLHFTSEEFLEGFQFTLSLEGLKVLEVIEEEMVTSDNFNLSAANALAVSINGAQTFSLRFVAEKPGRLSRMLRISDGIVRAEAYGKHGLMEPVLRFDGNMAPARELELYQNQPNPFSDKTSIGFYLPERAETTLCIFDVWGRLLFFKQYIYEAGYHNVTLENLPFEPGIMMVQIQAGGAQKWIRICRSE